MLCALPALLPSQRVSGCPVQEQHPAVHQLRCVRRSAAAAAAALLACLLCGSHPGLALGPATHLQPRRSVRPPAALSGGSYKCNQCGAGSTLVTTRPYTDPYAGGVSVNAPWCDGMCMDWYEWAPPDSSGGVYNSAVSRPGGPGGLASGRRQLGRSREAVRPPPAAAWGSP